MLFTVLALNIYFFCRPPSGEGKETMGDVVTDATVKALQEVSKLKKSRILLKPMNPH